MSRIIFFGGDFERSKRQKRDRCMAGKTHPTPSFRRTSTAKPPARSPRRKRLLSTASQDEIEAGGVTRTICVGVEFQRRRRHDKVNHARH